MTALCDPQPGNGCPKAPQKLTQADKMRHMNSETSFGKWLRRRRKALDLTQEKLAELVGCSHSAIRKFETDERRPSVQIAELLATHLEIADDQRTRFMQVARGVMLVDRLPASSSGIEVAPTSQTFIPPTNIPAASTPFIGRGQDIATLTKLIQDPHCRIITLLGQGGMGKTRLAIHVAEGSLENFDRRVYFVQLTPLTSPDSILPAIAAIFGLIAPNMDLKTRLIGYLREKHILLVLDNFEHLIQGANLLSEFLIQAPHLKLLVTSRERLNLQGEWTLELSGLTLPPETQPAVGAYDALQLFEQSVKRARPEFQFTQQDRVAAIHICNLVEGLPLAIELAAAWINVLSISEIAREIEKSFDFLKTSQRNMPERHKSLRAVFDHSWQLLTDDESLALSRLSIFQGGFSREAAEVVAGASLDILADLLAKSLIRRAENGRFDMHEAIRQYAASRLENEQAVQEPHARYYLSMLLDLEESLKSPNLAGVIQTLTHEFPNIHNAWEWGVQNKFYKLLHAVLLAFWAASDMRGRIREGFLETGILVEALRREPVSPDTKIWLGRALTYHAMFCYRSGDYPRGRMAIEESIAILRPLDMPQFLIEPLVYSSIIHALMGNLPTAQANVNEGVALARQFNDIWYLAVGIFNQGVQFRLLGETRRAYELIKEALKLWREMGNPPRLTGLALNYLSAIAIELYAREEARAYLEESLKLASTNTDRWGMGSALSGFGVLALQEGDTVAAENYIRQSIAVFTELGARADLAESLNLLGKMHLYKSEFAEEQNVLKKAIRLGLELNSTPQVCQAALEFADCLVNLDRSEAALAILGAVPEPALKVESVRRRVEQIKGEAEAQYPSNGKDIQMQSITLEELLPRLLQE